MPPEQRAKLTAVQQAADYLTTSLRNAGAAAEALSARCRDGDGNQCVDPAAVTQRLLGRLVEVRESEAALHRAVRAAMQGTA